eukprot:gnl/MRDRNA2_/MRDRNA2_102324_c0_seq1.p1 gnl/MRDRNA2_/MRDRNA2_102324_c0~~gnl/MRDRNA2_/MRDRNA2_102324_c0_seq1.p1  ORF type:complete len:631 (-),score=172.43 gnl/MRDRNA2_/MRDRNA2_102324_c0_seq1:236-2059(-)
MAPSAEPKDLAVLWRRVEKCLQAVQAQPSDFKPRSFLLPPLKAFQELGRHSVIGPLSNPAGLFASVSLNDSVGAVLLILALLDDRSVLIPGQLHHDDVWRPQLTLRALGQRLSALYTLFETLKGVGGDWDAALRVWSPSSLLVSGDVAAFWEENFKQHTSVPAAELIPAISDAYEALNPKDAEKILAWLRPNAMDLISIADIALVFDGPGFWARILFCTSWPELCEQALVTAVRAGHRNRLTASTAADLIQEKKRQPKLALLPQWSRDMLSSTRALVHALFALGMNLAADVHGTGLLLQFDSAATAQTMLGKNTHLKSMLRELHGISLPLAPATGVSMAKCVADVSAERWAIAEARDQHIAMSRIYARKVHELTDNTKQMEALQKRHEVILKAHVMGTEAPPLAPSSMRKSDGSLQALRKLMQVSVNIDEERQQWQFKQLDAEFMRNAEGSANEPVDSQRSHLAQDIAFDNQQTLLLMEINFCEKIRDVKRVEMSKMEQMLLDLEETFSKFRRRLILQDEDLTKRITDKENELVALNEMLGAKREEARKADSEACEMEMQLTELMVNVRPSGWKETEELLQKQIEAMEFRVEELRDRYKKAKAVVKK